MSKTGHIRIIVAPEIAGKFRHPFILETFDQMVSGDFFELQNDHDPHPLRCQFMAERTDSFTWEYVEEGPDLWRVIIGKV